METVADDIESICRSLRTLILEVDPGAVEVVRLGDRAATFGVGPKKMSEGYCYVLPYERWVNLGFYRGTDLPDPAGLLEGTGANMRHVKIRSVEEASRAEVRNLVAEALAERSRQLGMHH